jgi:purine-nucleoside phosphorylase
MELNISPMTAAARLKKLSRLRPTLATVLGIGFQHVLTALRVDAKISCTQIPGLPVPTVNGHAGELIFGHLGDTPVLVLSGRAYFYEGHPMDRVTFAVRALAAFGIRDLLLTNAAGGINPKFRPGDFMVVTGRINFMGVNPLRGPAIAGLNRLVDLTDTHDKGTRTLLFRAGKKAACGCAAASIRPGTGRVMKRRRKSARLPGWGWTQQA